MKKIYLNFLWLILTLILSGKTGLFAQQIIIEKSHVDLENTIHYEHHYNDDKYANVFDENNGKMYVANQRNPLNAEENVLNDVTVNVNVTADPSVEYNFIVVAFIDEAGQVANYYIWEGTNPVVAQLQTGVYDIITFFMESQNHIVIKENTDIETDMTIDVDVAEASNYISFKTYDENGDILDPGVINPETGAPSFVNFYSTLYLNPVNEPIVLFSFNYTENEPFGGDPVWNFYINDVSSRYSALQMMIGAGFSDNRYYALKYNPLNGISESVEIENEPGDWVYHKEKINFGGNNPPEAVYPVFAFNSGFDGVYAGNNLSIWTPNYFNPQEDHFNIYLNNPIDDNPLNLLVNPGIKINPYDSSNKGSFLVKEGNDVVYTSDSDLSLYFRDDEGYLLLPFHPKFKFSSLENLNIVQGENVPINVTAAVLLNEYNSVTFNYFGRFGEARPADLSATSVEIMQNGSIIFSGSWDDYFNFELPTSGQFEITFTNTYVEVEGLSGKNVTKLSYNADEQDAPPTLQKLQFRDSSGKMTDRFISASQGAVRLAAGDFQFNGTNYFEYNPGNSVEFYYAPYNQEEWTELELIEYPEYFQSPGVGDYYEASLTSVMVPEDNSWFDVKIICTDAAGNRQEQIVSPAFKIEQATMGIEEINNTDFSVYPNPFTNELNIQLPESVKEDYVFKISDLTGKIIHSQIQNEKSFVWNGASLPKGIYILTIESNGKTVAKKIMKK